jgi:predicted 3-demethylubiquinone-9 3-methyltransferase (glyoxalase superfamily)
VSWQVAPREMGEPISDPDPVKSARVIRAMLGMN